VKRGIVVEVLSITVALFACAETGENAPNNVDNTIFYVPNKEEYNDSLSTIMEIFPGQYEIIEGRPSFMTTGDIVIILGKDISRMYSF